MGTPVIDGVVVWAAWLPVIVAVGWVQRRRRTGLWHALGVCALTTYAFWIASVAFFPMPIEGPPMPGDGGVGWSVVNLVPLRELARVIPHQSVRHIILEHGGNLLLLAPFTLLGPALWARLRSWKWALALGVGLSVTIELLQLLLCALLTNPYRWVDIDDVILNTAGALLGYGLFLAARRSSRCLTAR